MGCLELIGTKIFPIVLSVISLMLSTFNLYVNSLRAPNLSFTVAPYISHVVDDNSGNESFFIPLTAINRGARAGTILSFELTVTYLPTQKQASYYGQYYAKPEEQELIGDSFSPMTIQGYSTDSKIICFYPQGLQVWESVCTGRGIPIRCKSNNRQHQRFIAKKYYRVVSSHAD